MRRYFAPLVVLAAVVGGCGESNPKLIPQANADALTQSADKVQAACDDHDTTVARRELRNLEREIDALPRKVDSQLRENLQAWADQVQKRITRDCREEETPTPTPTPTETEAPTQTPAPTQTATEAPTRTA